MKSAHLLLTVACTALAVACTAHAESEKSGGYELKNRSSFNVSADARIPFWPIGFTRPASRPDGAASEMRKTAAGIQIDPSNFSVTSVLLGHPALATINGRSFEEGEVLPVVHGGERLRVVLRAIRDGGITLQYESQQIFVPLKRPELGTRQAQQKSEPAEFTIKIGAPAQK